METMSINFSEKPYKASWGAIKFKGNAETVANEIESLGDSFTAQDMVDYARHNTSTELHKCFEWDDTVAAEKYRCKQANSIVCNLKITFIKENNEEQKTPIRYFYMPEKKCGAYKRTEVILRQADEYEKLLSNAKDELQTFKRKYSTISELDEVFEAIDRL